MWENNLEEEACDIGTQSNKIDFQLNPESEKFVGKTVSVIVCQVQSG